MQGIEPILQQLRIRKVLPHLSTKKGGVLVDFGCDFEQTLLRMPQLPFKKRIGIDIVSKPSDDGLVEIIPADLEKKLPIKAHSVDAITMLAVLEHLKQPEVSAKEAFRILKPGGIFVGTVPAPQVEPILNVFAKIGLVRDEMIDQHENYFTHEHLYSLLTAAGFSTVTVESWELGFNTFFKAEK